jgi:hypothetical protein
VAAQRDNQLCRGGMALVQGQAGIEQGQLARASWPASLVYNRQVGGGVMCQLGASCPALAAHNVSDARSPGTHTHHTHMLKTGGERNGQGERCGGGGQRCSS